MYGTGQGGLVPPPIVYDPTTGLATNNHIMSLDVNGNFIGHRQPTPGARQGRVDFEGRIYNVEVSSIRYSFTGHSANRTDLTIRVLSDFASGVMGVIPMVSLYRQDGTSEDMQIESMTMNHTMYGETTMDITATIFQGIPAIPGWASNFTTTDGSNIIDELIEDVMQERSPTLREVWAD